MHTAFHHLIWCSTWWPNLGDWCCEWQQKRCPQCSGGEVLLSHWFGGAGKGVSMRAPGFGGSDLLSIPRLRPQHLRPAGATLTSIRITWHLEERGEMADPTWHLVPILTAGILCHQQMRHSWDLYTGRRQNADVVWSPVNKTVLF